MPLIWLLGKKNNTYRIQAHSANGPLYTPGTIVSVLFLTSLWLMPLCYENSAMTIKLVRGFGCGLRFSRYQPYLKIFLHVHPSSNGLFSVCESYHAGDPGTKSRSDYQLDLFELNPDSTPRLRLYLAIWFAPCQLVFLTCSVPLLYSVAICTVYVHVSPWLLIINLLAK